MFIAQNPLSLIDSADLEAIRTGTLSDPFAVLGPWHRGREGVLVVFDPHAAWMVAKTPQGDVPLVPLGEGVFAGLISTPRAYHLVAGNGAHIWEFEDPYRFGPVLGELDLYLIREGTHRRLWQALGAHSCRHEGVQGVRFAVWAPNARRVSVVGPFNAWDGRRAPMRNRDGIWEIFLPGLPAGTPYKFEILPQEGPPFLKADPLARDTEVPPATASIVAAPSTHHWGDGDWMQTRKERNRHDAPISITRCTLDRGAMMSAISPERERSSIMPQRLASLMSSFCR